MLEVWTKLSPPKITRIVTVNHLCAHQARRGAKKKAKKKAERGRLHDEAADEHVSASVGTGTARCERGS